MLSLWIHQRKQLAKWMCSMFHSIHYFNLFFGLFRQMVLGWKNNDGAFPVSQGELWKREESSHMSGSRVHFKCLTQEDGANVHCLVFFGGEGRGGLLVSKVQSRSRGSCSASGSGSPAAHWTSTPENTSVLRLTRLAHFKYATEFYHFITMSVSPWHAGLRSSAQSALVGWLGRVMGYRVFCCCWCYCCWQRLKQWWFLQQVFSTHERRIRVRCCRSSFFTQSNRAFSLVSHINTLYLLFDPSRILRI